MIELPIIDAQDASDEQPKQRFWRSISHLKQDPGFVELAQPEFMPGADEAPSGASRRQFLQVMGASMAMAGLAACRRPVENILPYTRKPEEIIPGIPLFYATAMPFRGSLRALLVESHEGRPTKVEGNPSHPNSGGSAGLFEQASILNLYDPDRSTSALRDGNEASWTDFVSFCQQFVQNAASKRVAVLSAPSSSMTRAALQAQMAQRFPQLRWVTYRSDGDDQAKLGSQQAFGQPLRPRYHFSRAQVIASLDADFTAPAYPDSEHNAREYAASRRLESEQDSMSRLYVVESTYSSLGSMADHRLRLRASDIPAFAAALGARLGVGSGNAAFDNHPYVAEMANDLRSAGAAGVVVAGTTQPTEVHALCAAINSALGSVGTTVELLDTGEASASSQTDALATLVQDMNAGNVDALLMLDVNPVYDAPGDLDFAAAMQRVNDTIHVGLHVDETAQVSQWHIPQAHYLEAWGDGRSYEGTMSIVQPLIAPLYADAKSDLEVVNALTTGLDQTGYDLVRARWRSIITGTFEEDWRRVLHDGFLPNTAYTSVAAVASPVSVSATTLGADDLEVVFALGSKVLDGSYANNAWMQELPELVTKVTWDNVATMSPATAERLGLSAEYSEGQYYVDRVSLSVNGQSVELPVWILPGQADNSILVTLGYGRNISSKRVLDPPVFFDLDHYTDVYASGPLANDVGQNVAPLRTTSTMQVATGVQVQKASEDYMIATTQDHGAIDLEARALFRMATLDEYRSNPDFARDMDEYSPGEPFEEYPELWGRHPTGEAAYKDSSYYRNQWGMVIDLNTCSGCNACVVACQAENNIQVVGKDEIARGRELSWLRIDRYFVSDADEEGIPADPQMVTQPVLCMHCENAPCEQVCPVAATTHSPDGTNQMIYNRCIGTRYCANNCPYKVRRFNYFNWSKTLPEEVHMAQNPNVTVRSRGVMEKCSFCIQRVRKTQQQAKLEDRTIRDGEVLTACQQACASDAIAFGDLNDPNSKVSQARQSNRRYEMLEHLNVKPRVSYLARVRNPNPRLDQAGA